MAFIVTGGAGFIGSHLVEELVNRGEEVVVIDNLHTGSIENIKGFDVELIKGRAKEISSVKKAIDGIFHLGIYSSSPMYKENRFLINEAMEDFVHVMEFAKEKKVKVVLASTSSIYNGNPIPWKEDMKIVATDFYTETRYAMERIAEVYNKLFGVSCLALRLFSVYGPREEYKGKYANLVSQFLWSIKRDEPPVIFGDGSQSRDFVWVKDVVEAFILAMEKDIGFDVFNVGFGKNFSLNEVVSIINKTLGKNIKPKYVPNPIKNYVYHTLADTSKAEKLLGFKAKVSLEEGIKKLASLC